MSENVEETGYPTPEEEMPVQFTVKHERMLTEIHSMFGNLLAMVDEVGPMLEGIAPMLGIGKPKGNDPMATIMGSLIRKK